jgi:ABC-type transport system involved in multi-copper enzyme maturation permease subunit
MPGLKKLLTLIEKDFSEFFSSKSWIVVLVLPLFVTFLYTVIYRQAETKNFTVACRSTVNSSIQRIFTAPHLQLKIYKDLTLAKKDLATAKIDGVILDSPGTSGPITLLVDKTRAGEAAFVAGAINSALVRAYTNQNIPLIKLVYLNQSISTRWISLPIWLIQIILTICLLQAAASIADEKERQTIHSLLVSPMTLNDYMFSKLIWNAFIGTGSILLTLLLTGAAINLFAVILFALLGCLIFSAASILIGLFSPSALFARAVATLTYIVAALPMMIKDLSFNWKFIFNLFPSYLIIYGLERALLSHPVNTLFALSALGLIMETVLLLGITYIVLKHKADF